MTVKTKICINNTFYHQSALSNLLETGIRHKQDNQLIRADSGEAQTSEKNIINVEKICLCLFYMTKKKILVNIL